MRAQWRRRKSRREAGGDDVAVEALHELDDFAAVGDFLQAEEEQQEAAVLVFPFGLGGVGLGFEQAGFFHAADDVVNEDGGHAADEQGLGEHDLVAVPAEAAAPALDAGGRADDAPPVEEIEAGMVAEDVFFPALVAPPDLLPVVVRDGVWKVDFHGGGYSPSDIL